MGRAAFADHRREADDHRRLGALLLRLRLGVFRDIGGDGWVTVGTSAFGGAFCHGKSPQCVCCSLLWGIPSLAEGHIVQIALCQ
jgi:hypothetical protein